MWTDVRRVDADGSGYLSVQLADDTEYRRTIVAPHRGRSARWAVGEEQSR